MVEKDKKITDIFKSLIDEETSQYEGERIYEPISPGDFFLSEYHCGLPRQMIPKFWLDEAVDFIEGDYNELIITGSLGCLNKDTRIPTSKGLLTYTQIQGLFNNGVDIYVQSESGYRRVLQVHDNGINDTKLIETKRGVIYDGTLIHKFRVATRNGIEWRKFGDLKQGDILVKTRKKGPFGDISVQKEYAYLIGRIIGDGEVSKCFEGHDRYISLTYTDRYNDVLLSKGFELLTGGLPTIVDDVRTLEDTCESVHYMKKGCRSAAEYLLQQGLGKGAENKNIPEFVYTWDEQSLRWFIAGLIDSDGHVNEQGEVGYTSISLSLMKSLSDLLAMMGMSSSFTGYDSDSYYRLVIDTVASRQEFMNIPLQVKHKKENQGNLGITYNRYTRHIIPYAFELCKNEFSQFVEGRRNITVENILHSGFDYSKIPYLKYIIDNNCYFDEVISISDSSCHTMDLAVEGDPSYTVNGAISHNSYKTTWANLILMYKFYELFSWRSMHHFLDKPETSDIYSMYFQVSLQQAKLTGFKQFRSMLDESKWWMANYQRNMNLNSMIEFPKKPHFEMLSGSGHQHAIGMTLWSFILDEGDFFKKNGQGFDDSYDQVTNMYDELVDRRISRFSEGGSANSFGILISSASYQSSFVSKRIEDSANEGTKTKVINAVRYKIEADKFSDKKFVVFKGDAQVDPEIMDSAQQIDLVLKKLRKDKAEAIKIDAEKTPLEIYNNLPPSVKIKFETPPVDLQQRYRRNLHKALQNFSGVAVAAVGKLFQSKGLLTECYNPLLVHPFSQEKVTLSTGDDFQLKDYFIPRLLTHQSKPHAIHVDLSQTGDSTGISMVRFDGRFLDSKTGVYHRKYTQVFSLEITPPPAPHRIKIAKVRDFIIYLFKQEKVNIIKVTHDQYQSEDSLQLMADAGLTTGKQSIDKSDETYLAWMGVLMDKDIEHYHYDVLEREAFAAIHDRRKRKVDHPKKGDVNINVLQSFVGALSNLMDEAPPDTDMGDTKPQSSMRKQKEDILKETFKQPVYSKNVVGDLNNAMKKNDIFSTIINS